MGDETRAAAESGLHRRRQAARIAEGEVWVPAVAAVSAVPQGTGMHDLRHFYASLLIRHGESVKVVQARLGHATASETLDTYSHLWPDSDDTTRAAIDSAFRNIGPPGQDRTSSS